MGEDHTGIEVEASLILSPSPPLRHDIPLVVVVITNHGKVDIAEASFRIGLSKYPNYQQEQRLAGADLVHGKKQELSFARMARYRSATSVTVTIPNVRLSYVTNHPGVAAGTLPIFDPRKTSKWRSGNSSPLFSSLSHLPVANLPLRGNLSRDPGG